jgi:hypothetical protein
MGKASNLIPQDTDSDGNLLIHDDISTIRLDSTGKPKDRLTDTKNGWFSPFTMGSPDEYDPYKNEDALFSFEDLWSGFPVYSEDDIPSDADWL